LLFSLLSSASISFHEKERRGAGKKAAHDIYEVKGATYKVARLTNFKPDTYGWASKHPAQPTSG
jgi:hypothetical protein